MDGSTGISQYASGCRCHKLFEKPSHRLFFRTRRDEQDGASHASREWYLSVQSVSSYAVPSVLHVVCNTLVGAYVSFWMVYDFSMEWSYRVRYVRFVGHVIPALRLATYMLTQYQHTPMSRCWKCRFVFQYQVCRPGTAAAGSDGVPAEDPRGTSWVCNDPFVCAEDLCHYRCWDKNKGIKAGTADSSLIFKPWPNAT